MTRILAVLGMVALTGCATGVMSDGPPDAARIQRAQNVYIACLHKAARRLDDHKSPADTVGRGAMAACGNEWNAAMAEATNGPFDLARSDFRHDMQMQGEQLATQVVLEERKAGK